MFSRLPFNRLESSQLFSFPPPHPLPPRSPCLQGAVKQPPRATKNRTAFSFASDGQSTAFNLTAGQLYSFSGQDYSRQGFKGDYFRPPRFSRKTRFTPLAIIATHSFISAISLREKSSLHLPRRRSRGTFFVESELLCCWESLRVVVSLGSVSTSLSTVFRSNDWALCW